jgi:trimethylamine--corrinoid protein Co-methyltransferase
MVKHTVNGFSIDAESLAVDIIGEVGPAKDFLMHDHTFRHMRSQSKPELIDRKGMEEWRASGGKDIYQRATQAARDILDNHRPEPLPDDVAAQLKSIIADTEQELGVHKSR